MNKKFSLTNIFLFLLLTVIFYQLNRYDRDFNFSVLMTGNAVMAVLSLLTFRLVQRTMNERPQAFVRGVYSATFIKLLVCMCAILVYAFWNRQNIHKPSLFILFGIYAVYTAVETWFLSKLAKDTK